jgi:four helix bundle protein
MLDAPPATTLIAHRKALEAATIALALAAQVPAPYRCLANQVIRSASSVPANLSEGHGRSGGDRMYHWRVAFGSAKEVDSHLRLLVGAGALDAAVGRRHGHGHGDGHCRGHGHRRGCSSRHVSARTRSKIAIASRAWSPSTALTRCSSSRCEPTSSAEPYAMRQ